MTTDQEHWQKAKLYVASLYGQTKWRDFLPTVNKYAKERYDEAAELMAQSIREEYEKKLKGFEEIIEAGLDAQQLKDKEIERLKLLLIQNNVLMTQFNGELPKNQTE